MTNEVWPLSFFILSPASQSQMAPVLSTAHVNSMLHVMEREGVGQRGRREERNRGEEGEERRGRGGREGEEGREREREKRGGKGWSEWTAVLAHFN